MKTSQFNIQFPAGTQVTQVDDFPPKTPRSREGSVHVRPNSTTSVTPQEAEHIKSKGIKFNVLGKSVPPPVAAQGAAPAATPPTEPTPVAKATPEPSTERARPVVRRRDAEAPTE